MELLPVARALPGTHRFGGGLVLRDVIIATVMVGILVTASSARLIRDPRLFPGTIPHQSLPTGLFIASTLIRVLVSIEPAASMSHISWMDSTKPLSITMAFGYAVPAARALQS